MLIFECSKSETFIVLTVNTFNAAKSRSAKVKKDVDLNNEEYSEVQKAMQNSMAPGPKRAKIAAKAAPPPTPEMLALKEATPLNKTC